MTLRLSFPVLSLLSTLSLAGGCKDRTEPAASAPAASPATASPAADAKPQKSTERSDAAGPAEVKAEVLAALERWVAAQKAGDFAAYAAMYEPRTFRGVKRTTGGKVTDFDLAGWKADRKRMFERGFEVAAEPLGVETWLDPGAALKRGMSVVRFTQRWRSAAYADHGVKVLHFWRRGPSDLVITYEDLLNSERGWDRVVDGVAVVDMAPPRSPAEALALWKKLGPTGADYPEKLASIPKDAAVRRSLALALLAGGELACKEVVEYEECGTERAEWKELDPKADFDDPCLRRRLALWALAELESQLEADTLAEVAAPIAAAARLPEPEEELPKAVAQAVATPGVPESTRLAVVAALTESGREELAEVDGFSEKGLVAAAVDHGIDKAALQLDPAAHAKELASLAGDARMTDETRLALLDKLAPLTQPPVTKALKALTADKNCELAMKAAEILAQHGDESFLPRQRDAQSTTDAERALCMLLHDSDTRRGDQRLAEFLAPDGVSVSNRIEGPVAPEEKEEEPEEPAPVHSVDDVKEPLKDVFNARASDWGDNVELTFVTKGARVFLSSIDIVRQGGCGC